MTDARADRTLHVTLTGDGLLVRYIVLAEVVEPGGVESLRWSTSEGLADWTALGLLDFVAAHLRAQTGDTE